MAIIYFVRISKSVVAYAVVYSVGVDTITIVVASHQIKSINLLRRLNLGAMGCLTLNIKHRHKT